MGKLICVYTVFHNRADMTATQPMEVVPWLKRYLTAKTWVRSHASQCGIRVRLMGTGKGFSDGVLLFYPVKYNSIDAP